MKSNNRKLLERDGYCIVRNVFDQNFIHSIEQWTEAALKTVSANHRAQFKAQGCLIDISDYPDFTEVIGHQALSTVFDDLGLKGRVFSSGTIFSKPAFGPSLFWHQDWWGWDDPLSYSARIPQVNVMIYLSPTSLENGCLRVIPGSHRQKHPIHGIPGAYDSSLSRIENPDNPLYQSWEGESAVCVQPGDVVIKDTRLLHSAYPNRSNQARTLLSLNFNPEFSSLPEAIKARVKTIFMRNREFDGLGDPNDLLIAEWPEQQKSRIEHLFPTCQENVEPQHYNFNPNLDLLDLQ